MRIANIVTCVILLLGAVLRTAHAFSSEGFNFFFVITTLYFWFFVALLGISELNDTFKPRVWVTTYFNFLDRQFNKGFYIVFLTVMMLEETGAASVVFAAIITFFIALCNFIIGWKQEKGERPPLPGQENQGREDQYKVDGEED